MVKVLGGRQSSNVEDERPGMWGNFLKSMDEMSKGPWDWFNRGDKEPESADRRAIFPESLQWWKEGALEPYRGGDSDFRDPWGPLVGGKAGNASVWNKPFPWEANRDPTYIPSTSELLREHLPVGEGYNQLVPMSTLQELEGLTDLQPQLESRYQGIPGSSEGWRAETPEELQPLTYGGEAEFPVRHRMSDEMLRDLFNKAVLEALKFPVNEYGGVGR